MPTSLGCLKPFFFRFYCRTSDKRMAPYQSKAIVPGSRDYPPKYWFGSLPLSIPIFSPLCLTNVLSGLNVITRL